MSNFHPVHAPTSDLKFIGVEPSWDSPVSDSDYQTQLRRGLNWHNYVAGEKNFQKYLEEWVKMFHPTTAKAEAEAIRDVAANKIDRTIAALARLAVRGFTLDEEHVQVVENYIAKLAAPKEAAVKVAKTSSTPRVTIQDRMKQQVSGTLSNLDIAVDTMLIDKNELNLEAACGDIIGESFGGPQLKIILDYIDRHVAEWEAALANEDEQLTESYAKSKKQLKVAIKSFGEIRARLDQQVSKIKTQRIVRKKPQDKKKMASKVKFLAADTELGIKSLDPVDIIGASFVWVYDTKKRKLGYYESETAGSLYVKGTTILGWKVSCVKTIRKPPEQLKDFARLRKNQTVNWLMAIKAKCGELTGRTNDQLVILRID